MVRSRDGGKRVILLVSGGVIEVIPSLWSNYVRHVCVGKHNRRERSPGSAQPYSSGSTDSAVDERKATVFVLGGSAMGRHGAVNAPRPCWHWVCY